MSKKVKWTDTHGIIIDGADQMILKGFAYSSMEIKPGFYIDIYNIHTDADCDEESMRCRHSNYINKVSSGKAVIFF